jgi:hypothetical protein
MKANVTLVTRPHADNLEPTGRGLLATDTEQCPNTVRTCSQVGLPAVGEVRGRLRRPGFRPASVTPGDDQ